VGEEWREWRRETRLKGAEEALRAAVFRMGELAYLVAQAEEEAERLEGTAEVEEVEWICSCEGGGGDRVGGGGGDGPGA
jgi:hypothetical protein